MTQITLQEGTVETVIEQELWLCAQKSHITDFLEGKVPSWAIVVLSRKPEDDSDYFPIAEVPPFRMLSETALVAYGHAYIKNLKVKAAEAQLKANEIIQRYESGLLRLPAPVERTGEEE